ncbi:MAG: zinc ribbon domain-containing protein [Bryobacteraceae bacterium]
MPDFCTCGAQLPEDALFCHKCGKPQRDYLASVEDEPEPPPPPPPLPPAPVPIGFRNAAAVRVALIAGGLASLMSIFAGPLFLLTSILGGFFAVYLYSRRTGETLSVASGARLGWLSGLFVFVVMSVLSVVAIEQISQPEVVATIHENMKKLPVAVSDEDVTRMIDLVRSPAGVPVILISSFFLSTLLPAFGGAVGARLLRRD